MVPMLVSMCQHAAALAMTRSQSEASLKTHWGRDKMAAIFLTTFSRFLERKCFNSKILIKISLNIVSNVHINNIPALVQIMAWRLPGDKPLSESMMVRLSTHICVTRPQWVNGCIERYTAATKHLLVWVGNLHTATNHSPIWSTKMRQTASGEIGGISTSEK